MGRPGAGNRRAPSLRNYTVGYSPPGVRWNVAELSILDDAAAALGIRVTERGAVPHVDGDRRDVIILPPRFRWASSEWRAATLAHELMHAVGDWDSEAYVRSSDYKWREEMTAEMGAIVLFRWLSWTYPDEGYRYLTVNCGGWDDSALEDVLERCSYIIQFLPEHSDLSRETGTGC